MIAGCQTIKEKTDAIVEKENEKLSKYISKPASVLQMDLGKPDEDFKNAKGNYELISDSQEITVPDYFSPFEQKNIDIHFFTTHNQPTCLFKGDGDQDNPRIMREGIVND